MGPGVLPQFSDLCVPPGVLTAWPYNFLGWEQLKSTPIWKTLPFQRKNDGLEINGSLQTFMKSLS